MDWRNQDTETVLKEEFRTPTFFPQPTWSNSPQPNHTESAPLCRLFYGSGMLGVAKITSSFGETEEGGSAKWGRGCVNRLGSCKSSTEPAVLSSFLTATRRKEGEGR